MITATDDEFEYPAIGECSVIQNLSVDPIQSIEQKLDEVCKALNDKATLPDLSQFPSILFGLETLQYDIEAKGSKVFSSNSFTQGEAEMLINGLIWMGTPKFMQNQLEKKIDQGYSCIKIKIGALDLETELSFLASLRKQFGDRLEIRVDANGAFDPHVALNILERLSKFQIHSIEQPIAAGQWDEMASLCMNSPIPIALDEELIGLKSSSEKLEILDTIKPQYIILKPSLIGGLSQSAEWISLAEQKGIGWWITSALESNIGLNSIAQFTYEQGVTMPQGLGTGSLFTNNFESPLAIRGEMLRFNPESGWNLEGLNNGF